jgi:predicted MFS family arabinose efflux permease
MLTFAAGGLAFALFARPAVRAFGEVGLATIGAVLLGGGLALVAWTPAAWLAPIGCLASGLGFYMLHNTLQTNATQMAPERRGAGVALFASIFFLGQAVGVSFAGFVVEHDGAGTLLFGAAIAILPVGLVFARLKAQHRP